MIFQCILFSCCKLETKSLNSATYVHFIPVFFTPTLGPTFEREFGLYYEVVGIGAVKQECLFLDTKENKRGNELTSHLKTLKGIPENTL